MGRGQAAAAPPAPTFQPSTVMNGSTVVSKTYQDPSGAIVTQYLPDPATVAAQQQAQQQISQVMSTLGTTAPEMSQQFNQAANAFSDAATQQFNQAYDPALRSLREDIASRFGTLNSSQFLSGLDSLQQTKANALAGIAEKAQTVKADLVNQDQANKLNEIQSLGGVLSADQSNFLNDTKTSLSAGQALNDFSNSQWMQQLKAYTAAQNTQLDTMNSIAGAATSIIPAVANAVPTIASAF